MAGAVYGTFTRVGMGTTGGSMSERYEVLDCQLGLDTELVSPPGLYGRRDEPKERTREGIRRVGGPITLCPNVAELTNLLPRVLGGNQSGSTFPLADTLPEFDVYVDKIEDIQITNGPQNVPVIPNVNPEFLHEYEVKVVFIAETAAALRILNDLEKGAPRVPLRAIKATRVRRPENHLSVELTLLATASNPAVQLRKP